MKLLKILINIITKTKISFLGLIFRLIMKLIPYPLIKYFKVWIPLFSVILAYFRYFNILLGVFFLIALLDFSNLSFSNLWETIKMGYQFIKDSILYLIDKIFNTKLSPGRPKVDVRVDPIDKYPFPWYTPESSNLAQSNPPARTDTATEYNMSYLDRIATLPPYMF